MQTNTVEAFPLHWPAGFPRAKNKINSSFKCTLGQARDGVTAEIERMNGRQIIISSNIPVKNNGDMYASMKPVDGDHGVAVYFTWKNEQVVLACDQYQTIRENLRAIEKSIEAMRGLDRWGCSDILNRTFSGFKALPESSLPTAMWYDVIGVNQNSNYAAITAAYKELVKKYHPDNQDTGDREKFEQVQNAYSNYKATL